MDQCGKAVIIHLGILLGLQTIIPMAKKPNQKPNNNNNKRRIKNFFIFKP